jgi:hypothetical protein
MGRLFLGSVFFFGVAVLGVQARGETKVQYTWLIDPVVGASLTGAMPKTMEAGGSGQHVRACVNAGNYSSVLLPGRCRHCPGDAYPGRAVFCLSTG